MFSHPEQREVLDEIVVKMRAGRMSRRTFLERATVIGLSSTAALSLLEACGGSTGSTSSGPVTIVWQSENDTSGAYKQIVENFNKSQKDVHVNWQNGPSGTADIMTVYRNMLRARGATIDLMSIDVVFPAEFGSNGWVVALDSKWSSSERAKYLQGPLKSCTFGGKIWAAPFRTDIGLIYYRKDIVAKAPASWEELTTLANDNKSKAKYGYVWQGNQSESLVCDFNEVLNGYGGSILDANDPTKVTVNSPEAMAAVDKMASWVGGISPTAITTYSEEPARSTWQNGDAIFMRNWPYAYSLGNDAAKSKVAGKFDVHPMLPGGSNTTGHSTTGGWNLAINAYTAQDKQDAAWKFTQYLLGPDAQKVGATVASFTVALQSVYSDPDVQKQEPFFSKLTDSLQNALPRPVTPRYVDVTNAIQLRIHQALTKQSTTSAALSALAADLQPLVKK